MTLRQIRRQRQRAFIAEGRRKKRKLVVVVPPSHWTPEIVEAFNRMTREVETWNDEATPGLPLCGSRCLHGQPCPGARTHEPFRGAGPCSPPGGYYEAPRG